MVFIYKRGKVYHAVGVFQGEDVKPGVVPLARQAGIVVQSPAHMAQHAMYAPPVAGFMQVSLDLG